MQPTTATPTLTLSLSLSLRKESLAAAPDRRLARLAALFQPA
jgi:hypothetical protein